MSITKRTIGDRAALDAAVERFHERVSADPELAGYFEGIDRKRMLTRQRSREVDSATRAHDGKRESRDQVSLRQRYEEFCLAKVKDHITALPQSIRSQKFEEIRSAIRRAAPQLTR